MCEFLGEPQRLLRIELCEGSRQGTTSVVPMSVLLNIYSRLQPAAH